MLALLPTTLPENVAAFVDVLLSTDFDEWTRHSFEVVDWLRRLDPKERLHVDLTLYARQRKPMTRDAEIIAHALRGAIEALKADHRPYARRI